MRSDDGILPFKDEILALYPHTNTRALLIYLGRKSGWCNQQTSFFFEVHVLSASPVRPCTATMLVKKH
jgi:hypothetical protein